jgi:hypothetical protein
MSAELTSVGRPTRPTNAPFRTRHRRTQTTFDAVSQLSRGSQRSEADRPRGEAHAAYLAHGSRPSIGAYEHRKVGIKRSFGTILPYPVQSPTEFYPTVSVSTALIDFPFPCVSSSAILERERV